MHKYTNLEKKLLTLKGKTIAIVYIFEGDNSSGFEHFFIWKSNIISLWLKAVQDLSCFPLIIDVRTFVEKSISKTLPHIDFVLNLNSGTSNLSTMALVPSVCSSMNIPCIPCDATAIVTGEHKLLSNCIAQSIGLKVPKSLNENDSNGIFRPINLGNSMGVKRCFDEQTVGIYQEFIEGYDITTPVVYNPAKKAMDLLPTVIYLPINNDSQWYNGENVKKTRNGYDLGIIKIDETLKNKYLELVKTLSINTFCRIDARVKSATANGDIKIVDFNNTYFVEINVMPTIREFNNFVFSYNSIEDNDSFAEFKKSYENVFGISNVHNFLLSSSMLSSKTMC